MKENRPDATLSDEIAGTSDAPRPAVAPGDAANDAERNAPADFVVASHELLFVQPVANRCDACGDPLESTDEAEGYGIPGHGVYLWARGDEARLESVPLCA